MTRSLLWANLAIERLDRPLRQMKRLKTAYARMWAEQSAFWGRMGCRS